MAATVLLTPVQTIELKPALARPAPISPPIRACELLEGIPAHQVTRFQTIAAVSAAQMTRGVTTAGSMMPVPSVCATCRPKNRKAVKLKNAAPKTAACGGRSTVEKMGGVGL